MVTTALSSLSVQQRKVIRAWCVYDWANSAYATSGIAAIFPVYFVLLFQESLGDSASFLGLPFTGSSMWSLGIVVSTALVALSSPLLGHHRRPRSDKEDPAVGVHRGRGPVHRVDVLLGLHRPALGMDAGHAGAGQHRICRLPGVLQLLPSPHRPPGTA